MIADWLEFNQAALSCEYTADSTFIKDTRLSIYPRRRDRGPGRCPYFINLEYAVNTADIKSGCTVLGIVGVRAQVVAARLPPMKES